MNYVKKSFSSQPATDEYRDNYDRIFRGRPAPQHKTWALTIVTAPEVTAETLKEHFARQLSPVLGVGVVHVEERESSS